MKKYPILCINNTCNNVFFVEKHKVGLCLQCETCINKKNKIKE